MLFSWLKRRRRDRIARQAFPAPWETILCENVPHYRRLDAAEQEGLRKRVHVFLAEKYWEGCNGLQITDEIRVTIAGHACLLVLGFDGEYFERMQSILVYPDTFVAEVTSRLPGGVETQRAEARVGEAWQSGPVVLAWDSVPHAGTVFEDGRNVVLHEFAHCLDMQDWDVDGTPPLRSRQQYRTWHDVMTSEYNRLRRAARRGRPTLLDQYGATDPAEFFAVATECFFERSRVMAEEHSELYELLRDFYRQDPAARRSRHKT